MIARLGWLVAIGLAMSTFAHAQSAATSVEGMWSDPPQTAIGWLCAFGCTDAAIGHVEALLDDPANDARPYGELRAAALRHERENYFRPRLTAAALKTYPLDPADDPGLLRCEPWGLARQMFAPHQIQIRRVDANRVELRYGEWDARRIVHMSGSSRPGDQTPTRLGYSVGRWEGEVLVVETSRVTANITGWAFEHSDQLHAVERFTRADDGKTLWLTATLEDPWSLREAIVLKKIWRWAPTSEIAPYEDCEPAPNVRRGVK